MQKSLHVIVPGFGRPYEGIKRAILEHNVKQLRKGPWKVTMEVVVYDDTPLDAEDGVEVVRRPGSWIGNYLYDKKPDAVGRSCDLVAILLDDIVLPEDCPWDALLRCFEEDKLDLVSPSLHLSPWSFMHPSLDKHELRMQTAVELFFYVMTRDAYARYHALLDADNREMWGIDWLLTSHAKLECGVLNRFVVSHVFYRPSEDDAADPRHAKSVKYLADRGTSWTELRRRRVVTRIVR